MYIEFASQFYTEHPTWILCYIVTFLEFIAFNFLPSLLLVTVHYLWFILIGYTSSDCIFSTGLFLNSYCTLVKSSVSPHWWTAHVMTHVTSPQLPPINQSINQSDHNKGFSSTCYVVFLCIFFYLSLSVFFFYYLWLALASVRSESHVYPCIFVYCSPSMPKWWTLEYPYVCTHTHLYTHTYIYTYLYITYNMSYKWPGLNLPSRLHWSNLFKIVQ